MVKKLWCLPILLALLGTSASSQCNEGIWGQIAYECTCGEGLIIGVCRFSNSLHECGNVDILNCTLGEQCLVGSIERCTEGSSPLSQEAWSPTDRLMPKPRFLLTDMPQPPRDCSGNPQLFLDWASRKLKTQRSILRNEGKS